MFDSGSKNLQIHTYDGQHWGCHVRDADTALGIDNEGRFVFPPYLEDIDFRKGSEFIFNQKRQPEGSETVLNGQLGAIWINIRDAFGDRIQQMYTTLYDNAPLTKFNYEHAIKWFEDHQGQWSEALYNFGSRQYYGGAPYSKWISSGLGDKKNQRRFWLYYGFRYRASKYHAGSAVNRITWRQFGTGSDLQMKTYSEMYVSLGFGAYDYKTTKRYRCLDLENGVTVKNEFTTNVNDVVMYLFNGDMITDIGNLYEFGNIGSLDLTNAKRLRWLRVGNKDKQAQFINTKLTALVLTACDALEYLDLTSCQGFGTGTGQNGIYTLDLSKQTLLQEFYCKGATMSGITFPETPSLHTVHIGGGLSRLRLVNLSGLQNFQMENGSNLQSVIIRNCGEVSKTHSYEIIGNLLVSENKIAEIEIDGIDWQNASAEIVETLCDKHAKLKGKITILGANQLTLELKKKLMREYGDIDNPNNALYVNYQIREIKEVTIPPRQFFGDIGTYQLDYKVDSIYANNFVRAEWSMPVNIYATIEKDTGVLNVTKIGIEEEGVGPNVNVTITLYLMDGSTLEAISNLNFWKREVKVGDIVYHDGTVAPPSEHAYHISQDRVAIGVCFYIDDIDKTKRLMASLSDVGNIAWGVNKTDNPDIVLNEQFDLSIYDIVGIPNVPITGNYNSLKNADQWNSFDPSANALGQIGFVTLTENILEHKKGDSIPFGKYYGLKIIDTRNKLLSDSALSLPIPEATETATESTVLSNLMSSVSASMGSGARMLYYPAASYAYAYQPTYREDIKEEFKAHNWFVWTAGEMVRFGYHYSQSNEIIPAKDLGVLKSLNTGYISCISESADPSKTLMVRLLGWVASTVAKNSAGYPHRYVCAF
jgi:hypothetical protein